MCCIIAYYIYTQCAEINRGDAQVAMQGNAIQCKAMQYNSKQCNTMHDDRVDEQVAMQGMLDVTVTATPASPLSLFHQSCAFFFRPPSDCEVCKGHSFSSLGDSQYTYV